MLLRCAILGSLALAAVASMAQASNSELERELLRELHKMPPPATLPLPETLACYERLGKIAQFAPLPIQSNKSLARCCNSTREAM